MATDADKQALPAYREQLVCTDPAVSSDKECLRTVSKKENDKRTCVLSC